jgi:hypothetical protein
LSPWLVLVLIDASVSKCATLVVTLANRIAARIDDVFRLSNTAAITKTHLPVKPGKTLRPRVINNVANAIATYTGITESTNLNPRRSP